MSILPAWAAVHTVTVQDFSFNPANLSISAGDTVVWNCVQGTHNVHHTGNPSLFGNAVRPAPWTYTFVFNVSAGQYPYVCEPHQPSMAGTVSVTPLAAPEPVAGTVRELSLAQNYPNPFNGTTHIEFAVPQETDARLAIINVLGQQVAEVFRGHVAAGQHRVTFDAEALSSGVYFYRLETPGGTMIRTMHFLK